MALELSSFSGAGMILTSKFDTPPPPIAALYDGSARSGRTTARESGRCFGTATERSLAFPTGTFVGPLRRDTSAAPGRRRNLREKERALAAEAEAARLRDAAAPPSSRRVLASAAATALVPSARTMSRPYVPPLWSVSEDGAARGGGEVGTTASRIQGEMASRVTARWPKASLCVPGRGEQTGRSTLGTTARSVSTRVQDTARTAAPEPVQRVVRHDVGFIGATSPMEREVSEALMEIQRMRTRGYATANY